MTTPSPEYKRAAINWLLANGICESMTQSTGIALAHLKVHGVDYEASDMPDFTTVAIDSGDSFTDATYGEAFACTVYSLDPRWAGQERWQRRDDYTFWVGKDDMERMLLSQMIVGVINAAETGDEQWQARANASEVERYQRHIAAEALRAETENVQS